MHAHGPWFTSAEAVYNGGFCQQLMQFSRDVMNSAVTSQPYDTHFQAVEDETFDRDGKLFSHSKIFVIDCFVLGKYYNYFFRPKKEFCAM